jgi:hypothetical protein
MLEILRGGRGKAEEVEGGRKQVEERERRKRR